MDDDTAHFVLEAVDMVATHGWKLLPQVRKIWYTTDNLIVWLPFKLDINHVQYIQFQVLFKDLCPPVQCGTTIRYFPQALCKRTQHCLQANDSQHCWMLHVACVCTPCCMLLRKFHLKLVKTFRYVQTDATTPKNVAFRFHGASERFELDLTYFWFKASLTYKWKYTYLWN